MKINIKINLLLLFGLSSSASEVFVFDYSGNIRVGAQYHDSPDSNGQDTAMGANLHIESKAINGISAAMTLYTSNVLFNNNESDAVPFFSSDAKAYTILAEVNLQAAYGNTVFIAGRQALDTPFLDTDDIGMVPNFVEAYSVRNSDIEDVRLYYSYVSKMSGVDADIPERFSTINGGSGLHILGADYEGIEQVTLLAWQYILPSFGAFSYGELGYEKRYKGINYTFLAQLAFQNYNKEEDATIYGAAVSATDPLSTVALYLAYNKSSNAAANNGFGGGPFFTSVEHMTLAEAGADGEMFAYGMEWDASSYVAEGLGLSLVRADLRDKNGNSGSEVDVVVNYEVSENLTFDAIYSKIDNLKLSGDAFDNVRLFANYSF